MNNNDDKEKNNSVEDIEIIIGDDSNLEISNVEDFMPELKPLKEKKKNLVIPVVKKKNTSNKDNS
ncbi:MAG: hypothetical protein ACI4UE_02700 [Candidatus Scatovivens sp.]